MTSASEVNLPVVSADPGHDCQQNDQDDENWEHAGDLHWNPPRRRIHCSPMIPKVNER